MFGNDVLQLVYAFVIGIVPDAVINLQDVVANKPDEVREVRCSRLVGDKLQHSVVLHFVYVKRESPDGYPDHAFAVIEELNGLSIQREIVIVFIVEEVNGVLVEPEGESLEERNVVSHHLLVRKILMTDTKSTSPKVNNLTKKLLRSTLKKSIQTPQSILYGPYSILMLH